MKRARFLKVLLFAAMWSVFLLSGKELHAEEVTGYSTASDLNMRKKATTSSGVIKKFQPGDSMKILGTSGNWYKVESGKKNGYVYKSYVSTTRKGYSKADDLNFRKKASTSSSVIGEFQKGDSMTVLAKSGDWYKVKSEKKTGYVHGKYVTFTKPSSGKKVTGQDVVNYAKKFLGNPYVYGGTSLTKGADCSGFVQSIYKHFGYSLPRTSTEQRSAGKKVASLSKAKAGDLICYDGHIAIYMGNNKIIHASNPKDGIKISNNASYTTILAIRRILN